MAAESTNRSDEEPKEVWEVLERLHPYYKPFKGPAYVLLAPPMSPNGQVSLDSPFEQSELRCEGKYSCRPKA